MINTKKIIAVGLFIFIAIAYFHYGGIYQDKRDKRNFDKFNKYNLKDVIVNLNPQRATILKIKNDTLIFNPLTSNVNNNPIFEFTAKKGDSVIKRPFQDTLVLKKMDGSIYKYTFVKPSE